MKPRRQGDGVSGHRLHGFPHARPIVTQHSALVQTTPGSWPRQTLSEMSAKQGPVRLSTAATEMRKRRAERQLENIPSPCSKIRKTSNYTHRALIVKLRFRGQRTERRTDKETRLFVRPSVRSFVSLSFVSVRGVHRMGWTNPDASQKFKGEIKKNLRSTNKYTKFGQC